MGHRMQSLARLVIGPIWLVVATLLILAVWVPVAALVAIIDILYELALDRTLLDQNNTALLEPVMWYKHNLKWLVVGDHNGMGFRPAPYVT